MISNLYFLAALSIPLSDASGWQQLEYSNIKPNMATFSEAGLEISVDNSASPLIYAFAEPLTVNAVSIKGELSGLVPLDSGEVQGEAGYDDFTIRIGLIVKGDTQPSWLQKKLAPQWVKTLFSLAPEDAGVQHIQFLNVVQSAEQVGKERVHPLSELIQERFVWQQSDKGEFEFNTAVPTENKILGLWLSSDGDDTGAMYSVTFTDITLN